MGDRFRRDYSLLLGDRIIEPPLRVSFDSQKSIYGGLNKLTLRVWNLAPRSRVYRDAEDSSQIPVTLAVGYDGDRVPIFKSTIHTASSSREGADIVTEVESFDGGFAMAQSESAKTVDGGDPVEAIVADATGVTVGQIISRELTRPIVLVGSTLRQLEFMIADDETWFIDDGQLYIVKRDGGVVTDGFEPLLNAQTGLVNAPTRQQKLVTASTLMNPHIRIGKAYALQSIIQPDFDGRYRADTIRYSGDFDGQNWGQLITGFAL